MIATCAQSVGAHRNRRRVGKPVIAMAPVKLGGELAWPSLPPKSVVPIRNPGRAGSGERGGGRRVGDKTAAGANHERGVCGRQLHPVEITDVADWLRCYPSEFA